MVCVRNRDKVSFNIDKVKALGTQIANIKSKNSDHMAAVASQSKAGNLPKDIILAKNCKVLLTQNIWSKAGLSNGSKGTLKYMIFKCFPIVPMTKQWFEGTKSVTRTMLPLNLAYAISIHKSQGMTIENVIANIGPNEFSNGLTNTAITRVKKFDNLAFDPFYSFERFDKIRKQKIFKERLEHERKENESDQKFQDKAQNVNWLTDSES